MDLTDNIINDALDRYPNEYPKQVMIDARTITNWNREAYILGRRDQMRREKEASESQNPSTSDSALPTSDVVKSWTDIKDGDEFTVKCKVVKGKFELNLD